MFRKSEIDFNIEVEEDKKNRPKYPTLDDICKSEIYNNFVGGINDKCYKCLRSLSGKKRNTDYFILFGDLWCKNCANYKTKQHSFIEKLNSLHKSTNTSKVSSRNISRVNSDDEFDSSKLEKKSETSLHTDNDKILVRKRSYSLSEFTDFQKNVIKKINIENKDKSDDMKKSNKEQNLQSLNEPEIKKSNKEQNLRSLNEPETKKSNREQKLQSLNELESKNRSKTENGSEIKRTRSAKFKMFFFRRS